MKPHHITLALVLLVAYHGQTVWLEELQGPLTPIANPDLQDGTGTSQEYTDQTRRQGATSTDEQQRAAESSVKEPKGAAGAGDNERKASKFVTDKPNLSVAFGEPEIGQRSKVLQTAIFERLWNENLVRQDLKNEIEAIEKKRKEEAAANAESNTEATPTVEEIESYTLYENAMAMLSKPRTDKRVAYTLLRKAAESNHLKARAELAWAHLLGHWLEFNFTYAAEEFTSLVEEGIPEAHMGLAYLYSVGVGGKNISQPMALTHLAFAALGDNTYAQMAMGYRYSYGINVPISCEKSLTYYKKVAKKVASKVTFSNGPIVHRVRLLDESENPGSHETEIVDYYQLLADKGDVQSQVGLGQLYYQGGKATQQDHQKALEYFTLAANAGNAIGFAFLGKLYLEGSEHIKADNETALKYFSKAAEMGDPVGQSGLGLMYLKGLGVPKDPIKALSYFTQAADQGWVDGQLQLGNMYFTGNGVKTDYKLALKYFNLASQSGHVLAYYNLGIMHAYGMGMLRSCPAAVEFFKNVAERGRWSTQLMYAYNDYKQNRIDEAYMQYALMAELGYEVAQGNAAFLLDREEVKIFHDRHEELIRAFHYWKRAAGQGYSSAQVKLGDYYYYGWGTTVDFETAAALYRKASEQQYNAQAMFNLGYMHEQGLGMKRDWHLAKRLYDLAAETNSDARVPVAIALFKLQMLAKMETIKESPYKFIFYLDENIAANWDLYMITILTLLLGFIMYTRRPYQQQQENNNAQAQADQGAAVAPEAAAAPIPAQVVSNDLAASDDTPSTSSAASALSASTSASATSTSQAATANTTAPDSNSAQPAGRGTSADPTD